MSIEELCDSDTIIVATRTPVVGETMGVSYTLGVARTLRCLVQAVDSRTARDYASQGLKTTHQLFFSSDPSIGIDSQITWNGLTLEVQGAYKEGRPGETLLWVVVANDLATRDRA